MSAARRLNGHGLGGTTSNSVLATLTFDMTWRPAPPLPAVAGPENAS
jgi:hypothetical protein